MKNKILVLLTLVISLSLLFSVTVAADEEDSSSGYTLGDFNGDGVVNSQDAIYLLYHVFFGDKYPLNQSSDVNGDGITATSDAIYLLYHVFFPTQYELVDTNEPKVVDKYYDDLGNLEAEVWYGENNYISYVVFYSANGETVLTHNCHQDCKKVVYSIDREDNAIDSILVSEYNHKGIELNTAVYFANGSKAFIAYTDGKKTGITTYNADGDVVFTYECSVGTYIDFELSHGEDSITVDWVNEYDSYGNCVMETEYDSEGNITRRDGRKYNANGDIVEVYVYDSKGDLLIEHECVSGCKDVWVLEAAVGGVINYIEIVEYDSADTDEQKILCDTSYSADGLLNSQLVYTYDSNGRLTEQMCYNGEGSVEYRVAYKYNTRNALTKITVYDGRGNTFVSHTCASGCVAGDARVIYDGDGNVYRAYLFEYNADGSPLQQTTYGADGSVTRRVAYEYNTNGDIVKETVYDADGKVVRMLGYKYNLDGDITEFSISGQDLPTLTHACAPGCKDLGYYAIYDSNGAISGVRIQEYDASGNRIKVTSYDADGKITSYTVYSYDANGNQTGAFEYDANGNMIGGEGYEYDSAGNPIKYVHYFANGMSFTVDYVDGNAKKITGYNADGTVYLTYECSPETVSVSYSWYTAGGLSGIYEYDENGNYIKEIDFTVDGKTERIVEYKYNADGDITELSVYNGSGEHLLTHACVAGCKDAWVGGYYNSEGVFLRVSNVREYDSQYYDRKVLCYTSYDSNGNIVSRTSYEYDENGNRTGTVDYDADGNIIYSVDYSYNDSGDITTLSVYDKNGDLFVAHACASGCKDLWYNVQLNSDGTIYSVTVEEYDSQYYDSKTLQVTNYGSDGKIISRIVYSYDASGNQIGSVEYDANGNTIGGSVSEFDENGNRTKLTKYNADGSSYTVEYTNGNRTKLTAYESDGTAYITYACSSVGGYLSYSTDTESGRIAMIMEYDASGNCKKITAYDATGNEYLSHTCDAKYSSIRYYTHDGKIARVLESDADGNYKKLTAYNADGTVYLTYECSSAGEYIRYSYYTSGIIADVSEYDASGNCIKVTSYDADGKITSYMVYSYDATGNQTGALEYDANGNVIGGAGYEYDSAGNRTKFVRYFANGTSFTVDYVEDNAKKITGYNADGTVYLTYECSSVGGYLSYSTDTESGRIAMITEYDANGNITKETSYDAEGNVTDSAGYEYNSDGDIITLSIYDKDGNLFVAHTCASGCKYLWYYANYDSNGAISSVNIREYDSPNYNERKTLQVTNYGSDGKMTSRNTYKYDSNGNRIERVYYRYDTNGNVKNYTVYSYDANGNQTGALEYDANGNVIGGEGYEYDSAGNRTKYVKYFANGTSFTVDYVDGNAKKITGYNADGTVYLTYECSIDATYISWGYSTSYSRISSVDEYDASGNRIKCISYSYDENNKVTGYTVYSYDASGNVIKKTSYDADGNITSSVGYEYNSDGDIITLSIYDKDGNLFVAHPCASGCKDLWCWVNCDSEGAIINFRVEEYDSFNYNERKILQYTFYGSDGKITSRTVYEYDANGNQTGALEYDANGNVIGGEGYEYDSAGNPIKYVKYFENGARYILEYTDGFAKKLIAYNPEDEVYLTYECSAEASYIEVSGKSYRISSVNEYDASGNRIKYISYSYDENYHVMEYTVYEYDAGGKTVKETSYDADGNVIIDIGYEYNADGDIITLSIYDKNGNLFVAHPCASGCKDLLYYEIYDFNGAIRNVNIREYDSQYSGRKTLLSTDYGADGKMTSRNTYKYDSNGNCIERVYYNYDTNGNVESYTVYEYDANGNVIKITSYDADGNITESVGYEYNADGDIITLSIYYKNGNVFVAHTCASGCKDLWYYANYDSNGAIRSVNIQEYDSQYSGRKTLQYTEYGADGKITSRTVCEYDANGNVIKITSYDADGNIVSVE